DAYDPCVERPSIQPTKSLTVKKLCSTMKELQAHEPSTWSSLVAKSSVPYQYLENKGYLYFNKKVNPIFYLNTFTGRTKSVGFSIHGKGEKDEMKSVDIERTVFIHFDWVSADMRFGAIMSNDDIMMET